MRMNLRPDSLLIGRRSFGAALLISRRRCRRSCLAGRVPGAYAREQNEPDLQVRALGWRRIGSFRTKARRVSRELAMSRSLGQPKEGRARQSAPLGSATLAASKAAETERLGALFRALADANKTRH